METQMEQIECDVCHIKFEYEKWDIKDDSNGRPADELPDGYLIFGKWICDGCGSCSECGTSLEKEGNMTDHEDNKKCKECNDGI